MAKMEGSEDSKGFPQDVVEVLDVDVVATTLRSPAHGDLISDNGMLSLEDINCSLPAYQHICASLFNITASPEHDPNWEVERLVRIVVPTIFGVIVALGLLGNLLVILVVLSDKHMRSTTNILILMLALADLLFIVLCVPFTAASYALPVWPFGTVWCKIVQYLIYVTAYFSVYTLVLMSLDRYLAVVHAVRSISIRTEFNTWMAVLVTWTLILAVHVPLLFQYGIYYYDHQGEQRSICTNLQEFEDPHNGKVFFSCFLAFGYVLPLGIVSCLYGLMLKRLLYGVVPGGNQSQESIRAKKRVTRMVIIVVIIFAVCWLPIQIILTLQKFNVYPLQQVHFIGLQMASNCLAYMNSCVNPFLYAFLSENFRRSFRKFLCCGPPPNARGRTLDYERTNIRYNNDKDTKTTVATNSTRANGPNANGNEV
jgi:allatostatin receptor